MSAVDLSETERRVRAAFDDAAGRIMADAGDRPLAEPAPVPGRGAKRRVLVAAVVVALVIGVTLASVALAGRDDASVPSARVTGPRYDVTVFMLVDASAEQINAVRDFLEASSAVRQFVFLDKAAQLREFKRVFANDPDLVNNITAAALPTSYRVTLRHCRDVTAFAADVGVVDGVDSVTQPVSKHRTTKPGSATALTPAQCRAGRRTR